MSPASRIHRYGYGPVNCHISRPVSRSSTCETAQIAGANPMTAQDIADTIWWIANLPPHLNVNRIEVMPVSQSFAGFQVARD